MAQVMKLNYPTKRNMRKTTDQITKLSDDIRQIFIHAYGEESEMIRLCKDHRYPFLYHDKKPVLNVTRDEFVGIFNLHSNHYFLSPEQVFRLGTYCRLALPNLIALLLKAEWENFLSKISDYSPGSGSDFGSIIHNQELINMYISDFRPNNEQIFSLIRDFSYRAYPDITFSQIDFFIRDLLEGINFLIENDRIGLLYPRKDITEKILLCKITEQQRETYIRLKELWKVKSTELDDMLLYFERRKRLNLGIENKYFRTFAKIEAEKSSLNYRVEKYKMVLEIMRDRPELSYRELIMLAEQKLIDTEREKNEINNKIIRSRNIIVDIINKDSQSTVTLEFRNSYMQACTRLLRKLFFLLHTDTSPNYAGLSRPKKTEINKLWLRLMKSTKDELYSFSPTMLLYSLPDYEKLESIYKKACEILGINPECFEIGNRLEFLIRMGAPIEKILKFLKSETDQLELHLAHLELVQNEYTSEDQSQIYRDALADINGHFELLKQEVSDLKEQITRLKKEISYRLIKVTR